MSFLKQSLDNIKVWIKKEIADRVKREVVKEDEK